MSVKTVSILEKTCPLALQETWPTGEKEVLTPWPGKCSHQAGHPQASAFRSGSPVLVHLGCLNKVLQPGRVTPPGMASHKSQMKAATGDRSGRDLSPALQTVSFSCVLALLKKALLGPLAGHQTIPEDSTLLTESPCESLISEGHHLWTSESRFACVTFVSLLFELGSCYIVHISCKLQILPSEGIIYDIWGKSYV